MFTGLIAAVNGVGSLLAGAAEAAIDPPLEATSDGLASRLRTAGLNASPRAPIAGTSAYRIPSWGRRCERASGRAGMPRRSLPRPSSPERERFATESKAAISARSSSIDFTPSCGAGLAWGTPVTAAEGAFAGATLWSKWANAPKPNPSSTPQVAAVHMPQRRGGSSCTSASGASARTGAPVLLAVLPADTDSKARAAARIRSLPKVLVVSGRSSRVPVSFAGTCRSGSTVDSGAPAATSRRLRPHSSTKLNSVRRGRSAAASSAETAACSSPTAAITSAPSISR